MLQVDGGAALLELKHTPEPGMVDLGDIDARGVMRGAFAQEPEIALRSHVKRLQRRRFAFQHEVAAHKGLQGARIVRVDPGDELLGAHVEERQLHAFANGAGAQPPAPIVAIANDQDDFAIRAGLDEPDKAHRHVMPVVGHEKPAPLIEQMGQDRQLDPVDDLPNEAGDIARIAQIAHHALVVQPVHQIQRVCPGDLGTQRNERLVHLNHIWFQV